MTHRLFLAALIAFGSGCDQRDVSAPDASGSGVAAPVEPVQNSTPRRYDAARLFVEVTAASGLQENPPIYPDGTFMTPEITPGGVALLDQNNDGLLDILLIQHPPPGPWAAQLAASAPNRLFQQKRDGTFEEIPDAAGLGGRGFHHGVAVGDVNNDGFVDVYVCNFGGPDEFFLNRGNGRFVEATAASGFLAPKNALLTSTDNWSSTAAFFDCDADGDLDLWVAHFATFDPAKKCKAHNTADELDYCGPHMYPGQLASLWRNDGKGVFAEITSEAGINAAGRGWGIIAADLTGDGRADVLQANDEEPNQLWVNQGDGTFVDEALLRGCAVNAFGSVEANMGVAVGDTRNAGAGTVDLFMTHFAGETNTLWAAQGEGLYTDVTSASGMALIDRPFTGWGCGFFDYDNDGFLDLAIANGRVSRGPVRPEANVGPFWNRFAEPNLLFRGDGTGRFHDTGPAAGDFTKKLEVHRALAFADLWRRGAVDLLCVNLDNTLRIFRNEGVPLDHHWLQVLPMVGKREALGARVTLSWAGQKRSALCLRAYSYLASNDPGIHFGLGKTSSVNSLEIGWPSGTPRRERFHVPGVDRRLIVEQGTGEAL